MAAQKAAARWMNSVKVSTLVLINDAEYDLESSTGCPTLANWGRYGESAKKTFTLSLVPRDNANENEESEVCLPLVITVPFTQRFKLSGPAALTSPFMPLLDSRCPLEYTIEFVKPQATESDYVWDNFQDQVVVQTRLSKLVIKLQAIKEISEGDSQSQVAMSEAISFFPRSLPEIKTPSLKLFEYIEKNHRAASTEHTAATRRPERVSESFNGRKKPTESALAPLRPRSPASAEKPVSLPAITSSRPSSSEITKTPPMSGSKSTKSELPAAAEVNSQMEAKAVILRLRARNSTRIGANSLLSTQGPDCEQSPEEPFPESRLDAKTKAELDDFNHLVVSVKEGVKRDQASAKSELDYYRQFLPRAPSDTLTPRDTTPRETVAASPSLKPLLTKTSVEHSPVAAALIATQVPISNSTLPAKRAKQLSANKAPSRLLKLPALSSAPQTASTTPNPSFPSLGVKNNQETSPVRASTFGGAGTGAKMPNEMTRATQVARSSPQQPHKSVATTKSSATAVRAKAGRPPADAKFTSLATQQQHIDTRVKTRKQSQQPVKRPTTKKTNQLVKMLDPEAALSDFDDPDPEIDDAPLLPDDLSGMRASHAYGDDDDEY